MIRRAFLTMNSPLRERRLQYRAALKGSPGDGRSGGYQLGLGVGIATGYATLGRIGFEGRYDYGAVGNVVILAARRVTLRTLGETLQSQRTHAAVDAELPCDWSPENRRSKGLADRCRLSV